MVLMIMPFTILGVLVCPVIYGGAGDPTVLVLFFLMCFLLSGIFGVSCRAWSRSIFACVLVLQCDCTDRLVILAFLYHSVPVEEYLEKVIIDFPT